MDKRILAGIWLAGMGFGLSGCATKALWENHAFAGFNEPARPANLQVFRAQDDWLVRYDEVNENNDRIRARAYFLKVNDDAIKSHKQPRFVRASTSPGWEAVQVVVSPTGQQFTLYEGSNDLGTYELPIYPARSGRVKQVLLTPAAVVADATIVGGYLGIFWLYSGAPPFGGCH